MTSAAIPVLLLGTVHMNNPGRDAINVEVDDVSTPHRQAELRELAEAIAVFAPTKVCVEWSDQSAIDAAYDAYQPDATDNRGEIHQVAFRVASLLGHDRCYAVDDTTPMRWDRFEAYLERNPADAAEFDEELRALQTQAKQDSERLARTRISDYLREINTDEALRRNLAFYIDVMRWSGAGAEDLPALAASWYERNLRIFANIARATEPGDRAFVLLGSGHVPILRHLIETSTTYTLVDTADYLP